MSLIAKALIILLVVAVGVTVVIAYNNAIEKAARLEKELKAVAVERDGWLLVAAEQAAEKQRLDTLLVAREIQRNRAAKERDRAYAEIAKLRERPDVKPWADTPIPEPVLERLRRSGEPPTPSDDKKDTPKRVIGGNPDADLLGLSDGGLTYLH